MYKKVIFTALMLGVCVMGVAQTQTGINQNEMAETTVLNSHKSMLENMQLRLNDRQAKVKVDFGNAKNDSQFLYQPELVDSMLKVLPTLDKVYKKLCNKDNVPTNFQFEEIVSGEVSYKTIESGKNQGGIDSSVYIVPISFQAHTVSKDGASDVKYAITFEWEIKSKVKNAKVKEGDETLNEINFILGRPKLLSSKAEPINFLRSDQERMMKVAKEGIVSWYANLPEALDEQYAKQSVSPVQGMTVKSDEVKMTMPASRNFKVNDVPQIKVDIDPYQFISESDRQLYTDPVAYMIIAPEFNISIDNNLEDVEELGVAYTVKEIVKPVPDAMKELRRNAVQAMFEDFAGNLSNYVASNDKSLKSELENMFVTPDSEVEVSFLPKNGTEKIYDRTAQKYLARLKGNLLNVSVERVIVEDSNWESIIYLVGQEYSSNTYSDCTQKQIHFKYDASNNKYSIEKISVVPGSTRIK